MGAGALTTEGEQPVKGYWKAKEDPIGHRNNLFLQLINIGLQQHEITGEAITILGGYRAGGQKDSESKGHAGGAAAGKNKISKWVVDSAPGDKDEEQRNGETEGKINIFRFSSCSRSKWSKSRTPKPPNLTRSWGSRTTTTSRSSNLSRNRRWWPSYRGKINTRLSKWKRKYKRTISKLFPFKNRRRNFREKKAKCKGTFRKRKRKWFTNLICSKKVH